MQKGFTLAELLITLGVIGVVAALTIPTVVNYFQAKELEARFKKADNIIQQALQKTVTEYGYTSITDFNIRGRQVTNQNFAELQHELEGLNEIWLKQFNSKKALNGNVLYHQNVRVHDILGNQLPSYHGVYFDYGTPYQLTDGMLISEMKAYNGGVNHPAEIKFIFDTNGPYKGPNRYGHDVFVYNSLKGYEKECNPVSGTSGRNRGCYDWAHANKNPIKPNKPYWDILFKPASYWQNN